MSQHSPAATEAMLTLSRLRLRVPMPTADITDDECRSACVLLALRD